MAESGDGGCAGLEAQVAALERENAILRTRVQQLERTVRQLQKQVQRLKQALEKVRAYCMGKATEAHEVLSTSGHPRGTWSLSKGRYEIARTVLAILGVGQ